jgi:creatinine amidohydrolase
MFRSIFTPRALAGLAAVWGACLSVAGAEESASVLSVQYEELTAPDFVRAVEAAQRTVVIPLGIIEKHGPHLPLGTDLLDAREVALRAARREYAVVFPPYYFGQIYEAQHQPGTLAYSPRLIWDLLQETCDQLGRNGFRRIVLVNGHGGNTSFVQFFVQAQLERRRPYAVFLYAPEPDAQAEQRIAAMRKTATDMHAGETETSMLLAHRPDLVHPERAQAQSGQDQRRLDHLRDALTGIWWYARFPNHYAGDGGPANRELGEALLAGEVEPLVRLLRAVKADETALDLQERFFEQAERPLETPQ